MPTRMINVLLKKLVPQELSNGLLPIAELDKTTQQSTCRKGSKKKETRRVSERWTRDREKVQEGRRTVRKEET